MDSRTPNPAAIPARLDPAHFPPTRCLWHLIAHIPNNPAVVKSAAKSGTAESIWAIESASSHFIFIWPILVAADSQSLHKDYNRSPFF